MEWIKVISYVSAFIVGVIAVKSIMIDKRLPKKGGVHESVYIDKLKALESRIAFLELKEYDPTDFVHYDDDNDFGWLTLAKSERDYGDKIRVGKNVLIRKPITQTNQKYYEYINKTENRFIDIRERSGRAY